MKPKLPALTEIQIDGEEPAYAAWQVLMTHMEGSKGEERIERIRCLPQHWRSIYTGSRLENEVLNGGFHQFFWNNSGALNKETLEDLRLISAGPFILLFEEAMDEYQQHDYRAEKAGSRNSWEGFTAAYKEKRMADLDAAFYKVPKPINAYLSDYIRNHRSMYSSPK